MRPDAGGHVARYPRRRFPPPVVGRVALCDVVIDRAFPAYVVVPNVVFESFQGRSDETSGPVRTSEPELPP